MNKIKSLTIVTGQGVKIYTANSDTEIIEGTYFSIGDPFECFHVIQKGSLIAEIRCVHQIEIEYYPLE